MWLVARRRGMGLGGWDWQTGRLIGWLDGGRSESGLDSSGILCGEISLSLQKVDVCPSLGDKMEDEG